MAYKNLKPGDRVRIKQHLRLANAGYCGTVTADGRRVLIDADAKWSPGKEYDYDEDELELIDRVVETRTFKVGDRVKCVGSTLSVEGKTGTVTKLTPYITVDFDDSPKGYTFDPDTAKKYLVALDKQNENEIQIGDTVRIVRKTEGTPQWNAGAPSTEPSTPATPTPSTSKDSTMSSLTPVNIEQRTFVTLPGTTPTDAKNLTDDQLIEAIAQGEAEIERLGKIKAGSKGVAARIAKLQEGVDGLVALLDARTDDGKAKKAAK